ncbi:MAG: hypothetical protein WD511_00115 [Balneolaceae bacterium]
MNTITKLTSTIAVCFMLLLVTSCADMVVENQNEPGRDQAITSRADVEGLVVGAWETWAYYSTLYQTSPLLVQADWYTGTVGNFWVNDAGHESGPIDGERFRTAAYPNTPTTSYPTVVNFHWENYYVALSNVNTALAVIEAGEVDMGTEAEVQQLKATAQLLQGIIYGSVGLIFDKGYVIDETFDVATDIDGLTFTSYSDMVTAAVSKLEEAKTTASAAEAAGSAGVNNSIIPNLGSVDSRYPGAEEIDWSEFEQIANTYAASFLAQYPRSESDAVDWDQVYEYASNGLTFDFAPYSDDNYWAPYLYYYMNADWFRVDMKVVNKLDSNQPLYWPTTDGQNGQGPDAPSVESDDARFGTDYNESYTWSVFNPTRGYFKRTHVTFDRYDGFFTFPWSDPIPYMMRAQNNLLLAEAELNRTGGNVLNAIEQINDTRVGRGELAPLTAVSTPDEIQEALEYEWDIEVAITGVSTLSPWYNSRRWGQLLRGSMLHLPVPAGELGIIGEGYYTFGGEGEGSAPKFNMRNILDDRDITPK